MATSLVDLSLLNDPVAQQLLHSTNPAHLAYTWHDGTPRVVPIWFYWNGEELVLGTPPTAPKLKVLENGSRVAVEIDDPTFPYKVLIMRGTVTVETVEGMTPEYTKAAQRYFGEEQGLAWSGQVQSMFAQWTRVAFRPDEVSILDFESRFPQAFMAAMKG